MQHFNLIQSKWVVAIQIANVQLLQQSIPFGIAIALKASKTSSLYTIILEKQMQTKHLIALIFI